ncbi:thioredoxin fold domain-containing protein [Halorhodospira sp. 9621]|uniref:thioredoxin fold domain-containing protein n=1 Tax=unclassified Halorhodospira TaxID=2626748 RepID=UPI001EE82435|nr:MULTISPECIES: thioredoxin fold domain-containing protein [unclassified Halorhodospira]MCG5532080.1 thioredoxin fold domain-containing protein [Halorhodospira sp. 9621]MCG5538752.1 thioredoxin fold domain-containing protein [Halorhodospira sp. 9622]
MSRVMRQAVLGLVGGAVLMVGCSDGTPGESARADVFDRLADSHYIAQGESDFRVYAFKDPHCPACTNLKNAVDNDATPSVEWRWVPVGFLGSGAQADAAAMIEDEKDVDGYDAVQANMRLAQELGVRSVPTVFYRDTDGEVRFFVGGEQQALDALERMAAE